MAAGWRRQQRSRLFFRARRHMPACLPACLCACVPPSHSPGALPRPNRHIKHSFQRRRHIPAHDLSSAGNSSLCCLALACSHISFVHLCFVRFYFSILHDPAAYPFCSSLFFFLFCFCSAALCSLFFLFFSQTNTLFSHPKTPRFRTAHTGSEENRV